MLKTNRKLKHLNLKRSVISLSLLIIYFFEFTEVAGIRQVLVASQTQPELAALLCKGLQVNTSLRSLSIAVCQVFHLLWFHHLIVFLGMEYWRRWGI